jgi:hypothetical protein
MIQQKISATNDRPSYTKTQLIEEAHKQGFTEFDTRQLTDFTRLGLICKPRKKGKPGGGSEEGRWSVEQLSLLLTILRLRHMADSQVEHHLYRRNRLCAVPVSGWLYWGEEHTGVPLDQVKRAITAWAKAYKQSNAGQVKQETNTLLQFIASPHATKEGKKDFKEELGTILYKGMPLSNQERDTLYRHLQYVIDPDDRGEVKGPKLAPLSAASVLQLTDFRLVAIQRLLSSTDIPDTLWEWARASLWYSKKLYQEMHSHLLSDPAMDESLKPMFVDKEPMMACEDLLTMLGMILSELPLPGLPPFLQPQIWLDKEATCSIQVTMKRSQLLLPNGAPYEYISREITITARQSTDKSVSKQATENDSQEKRAMMHVRFTYP